MGKLNIFLFALVIACALKVVDWQHQARSHFVELNQEQQVEQQLEVSFTKLQLQQVALAKGERVDSVARTQLKMKTPPPEAIVFLPLIGLSPNPEVKP